MPVLVIDKPQGLTSFAVVKAVARHVRTYRKAGGQGMPDPSRVGHGGTLDPMATGVLPVCIGESTKLAPFLLDAHKAYEGTVTLGVQTDTLDAEGQVVAEAPVPPLSLDDIEAVLQRFRGAITQVPPMHSALKRDGKPLYAYARQGQELEREARALTIFELRLIDYEGGKLRLFARCSKGTYIRVLAADIGLALGPGGHLSALRRTASGPFSLAQAITLDDLAARAEQGAPLPGVGLTESLAHMASVTLTPHQAHRVGMGQKLPWADLDPEGAHPQDLLCLLRPDGTLLAVAERNDAGLASLRRVFLPETDAPLSSSGRNSEGFGAIDAGNVHSPARDG
ncbi:MAG: tRNA pseudouridine(55) synthase TruB [Deltaproteobacteria bacterium]|nr:tRNA pseudouridine(55) synthase TruB [Deltaproteobacteria bacterium]